MSWKITCELNLQGVWQDGPMLFWTLRRQNSFNHKPHEKQVFSYYVWLIFVIDLFYIVNNSLILYLTLIFALLYCVAFRYNVCSCVARVNVTWLDDSHVQGWKLAGHDIVLARYSTTCGVAKDANTRYTVFLLSTSQVSNGWYRTRRPWRLLQRPFLLRWPLRDRRRALADSRREAIQRVHQNVYGPRQQLLLQVATWKGGMSCIKWWL